MTQRNGNIMKLEATLAPLAQKKRGRSSDQRLIFGYVLQMPDASEANTVSQTSIITSQTVDFVFHDAVSFASKGSPIPAFDLMLTIAVHGDIVLVDEADRLIGPILGAFASRLAAAGIELIFIDEHYEAGRGK
jgi:hypothetical protein